MIADPAETTATLLENYPILKLAPPVLAIGLAILLKDVNTALLFSILIGALLLTEFSLTEGIEHFCDVFVGVVADADHASVVLFTVLLGAMIGLMNDSGGTTAVVNRLATVANSRKRGQVLTWLAGMLVFFDDYANTMLIGGSIRPLTDRLKISRAKLAFLIDATAAPIAGLALSTWTAFEIDQVKEGLTQLPELASLADQDVKAKASELFFFTIPYRLYPILAILMVGAIAISGKDFGPMLKAERAPKRKEIAKAENGEGTIWTAIIPIGVLLLTVVWLLWREASSGNPDWLSNVDSYRLLLLTALAASTSAGLAAIAFGRMNLRQASESWGNGITSMIPAIIVLILAWGMNAICAEEQLGTAGYIIDRIGDSIRPQFLPAIAFLAAGAMAVSIGSSFTTMGLLIPLFIPLAAAVLKTVDIESPDPVFLSTIGAILAGAIFGDHCSPISDTTVLSSAAAGCDHLEHVATQVPYALLAAACSLFFGYLPMGFGVPWWLALPISTATCIGAILFFGTSPERES